MYLSHFNLRESPFSITPDPRFVFLTERHREALAHLIYGLGEGGGFVQLTGEIGTGKTTVCRMLLRQLPEHVDVALIFNPQLTVPELLDSVCAELKIERPGRPLSAKDLVDRLYAHLLDANARGRRTVLIIDEAQNLSMELLEEVRLLTNLETDDAKLLQVFLIGQPELRSKLASKELRQLAQRVTARYHLDALSFGETRLYIRHRLSVAGCTREVFDKSAVRAVHRLAAGVPRRINILCDRALLGAYTTDRQGVNAATVRRAAAEIDGAPAGRRERTAQYAALCFASLAVLTIAALAFEPGGQQLLDWVKRTAASLGATALSAGTTTASGSAAAGPDEYVLPLPLPLPAPASEPDFAASGRVSTAVAAAPAQRPALDAVINNAPGIYPHAPAQTVLPTAYAAAPVVAVPEHKTGTIVDQLVGPSRSPPGLGSSPLASADTPTGVPADLPSSLPLRSARLPAPLADLDALVAALENDGWSAAVDDLLRLWSVPPPPADADLCTWARRKNLACHSEFTSWPTLRRLDLPAVLRLIGPADVVAHTLLLTLSENDATLMLGGQKVRASRDDIERLWRGEFFIFWRPPLNGMHQIMLGHSGRRVLWLQDALAAVDGAVAPAAGPATFGDELLLRVKAFQRQNDLKVDGIVGPQTFILLSRGSSAEPMPSLQALASKNVLISPSQSFVTRVP